MDESVVAMWLVRAFDGVVNITKKLIEDGIPISEGTVQHVTYLRDEMSNLIESMKKAVK